MYTMNAEQAGGSVFTGSHRLFLGDLSYDVDESSISEYCKTWGELAECRVMRDRRSGRGRGFAFVRFKSSASVNHFLNNTHYIGDSRISVKVISKEQNTLDVQPLLKLSKRIFAAYCGRGAPIERLQFQEYFSKFGVISELTTHSSSASLDPNTAGSAKPPGRSCCSGFAVVQFVLADSMERCFRGEDGAEFTHILEGSRLDVRRIISEEDLMKRKRKLVEEEVMAEAQIAALERKNADGSAAYKRPR